MSSRQSATKEVVLQRLRILYLEQGIGDVRELRRILRAEGLISTRRNVSADRRIREYLSEIDAEVSDAVRRGADPTKLSEIAIARSVTRNETIFREALAEFRKVEGETVTETEFRYPNGKKMRMRSVRKADRGGMRARMLREAKVASDTIDALRGVVRDVKPAEAGESDGSGEGRRVLGLIIYPPDPEKVIRGDADRRRLLAEMHLAHGEFGLAWLYMNYPGDEAAFGAEVVARVRTSLARVTLSQTEEQERAASEYAEALLRDYMREKEHAKERKEATRNEGSKADCHT